MNQKKLPYLIRWADGTLESYLGSQEDVRNYAIQKAKRNGMKYIII